MRSSILVAALITAGLSLSANVRPVHALIADGLKCYRVNDPLLLQGIVQLSPEDLGLSENCTIRKTKTYCVPVGSEVVSATDNGNPLTTLAVSGPNPGDRICYKISCPGGAPDLPQVSDVFGTRTLQGVRATTLCVPAVEGAAEEPVQSGGTCSAEAVSNLEFILDCSEGEVTGTVAPIAGSPELHIISIYGPNDGTDVTVTVEREQPTVLVLSGFDPVHWHVVTTPGANLERVIATGFEQQEVTAPAGIPVEIRGPYPNNLGSAGEDFGDYLSLEALAILLDSEQATGLCMTSYHACYEASQFRIPPSP